MKALILFLLSLPAWANHVEISAVRVHENTMVLSGVGFGSVQRATLGNKVVQVMPAGAELVIACRKLNSPPCANERWIPGNFTLKLFKANKVTPVVKYPVVITGLEKQIRPTPPEVIMPRPVTGSGTE